MIYMYDSPSEVDGSKQVNILRYLYINRGCDEVLPANFEGERNKVVNHRDFTFQSYIVKVCILRFFSSLKIHCIL